MTNTNYTWGVARMSAGFFFLFMAFNTAQNLFSTIVTDNQLVNASLASLYGVFTVMTVFAPAIVNYFGPRISMALGAIPYVLLVFANVADMAPPPLQWGLFIPAFAGVGAGAAILWTAQGMYLSRCAILQASATGSPVEAVTSSLNALFWTAFQFNGAVGLVIASTIFVTSPDYKTAVTYLFLAFGVVGSVGIFVLLSVPPVSDAASAAAATPLSSSMAVVEDEEANKGKKPAVSIIATLRLLCKSKALVLLVPIIFYNGASLGFNGAMYPLSYADTDPNSDGTGGAQRLFNHKMVGFVSATFYLSNSLFSYAWGHVVPRIGRRPLFFITLFTHIIYFIGVFFFVHGIGGLTHDSPAAYAAVFTMAVVFAAGDSVLESQVPAIIQSPTFFPDEGDRDAAVSNLRLWQSLGFTVQFGIGIVQPGDVLSQLYFVAGLFVLALLCLWICDTQVQPVDTPAAAANYAAINSSDEDSGVPAAA